MTYLFMYVSIYLFIYLGGGVINCFFKVEKSET